MSGGCVNIVIGLHHSHWSLGTNRDDIEYDKRYNIHCLEDNREGRKGGNIITGARVNSQCNCFHIRCIIHLHTYIHMYIQYIHTCTANVIKWDMYMLHVMASIHHLSASACTRLQRLHLCSCIYIIIATCGRVNA